MQQIPLVKILLHFSDEDMLKYIESERNKLENLESEIDISSEEVNVQIIEDKSDYLEYLNGAENNLADSKIECLNFMRDELTRKLREYYYFEEDLFPDFEKRIQYLSNKYQSESTKKVVSDKMKPNSN
ncbi:MAG: hypothetical protein SPI65_04045 [Peptoniphilus sp.]|nr:hypothetical protein [Peptoniphilus sp.]MDY6044736.1 hypothetical protein [Peptoniphilus sp.]